jgi:hypothetical protein
VTDRVRTVRVFVSYAWDDKLLGHVDGALELANSLRAEGLESHIDRYVENEAVFWPRWMADQVTNADFVLCLASPLYKRRFEQRMEIDEVSGSAWEGLIISEEMYRHPSGGPAKFISVLLGGATRDHIPDLLHPFGYTFYSLPSDYIRLLRRLTNQPAVIAPPVGRMVVLDPE